MAKKKTTKEVVEEVKVEKAETVEVERTKEEICEFYGISDEELLSQDCDLSKYNLNKWDEWILLNWVEENKKVKSWDVVFDMYTTNTEAWAIIEKYGVTPEDVAEWRLDELTKEEKEVITAYYNDLISKL